MTDNAVERQGGGLARLQALLESRRFQNAITALIVANALILGLQTSKEIVAAAGGVLDALDRAILCVFVVELLAKMAVYRRRFHRDAWNVFDLVVVTIALIPASGPLSVLRALRVLRVLRLVSTIPSMRRVVEGLLRAIPGMGSVLALLLLVYYVFAVMTTQMYGEAFPALFGNIWRSAYSLFQVMTLESWSQEIVRPVMEVYPYAWALFVPFILTTSFTVLNLFIAVIVSAVGEQTQAAEQAELAEIADLAGSEAARLETELRTIRSELKEIRALLEKDG